jgi:hypothetical protein
MITYDPRGHTWDSWCALMAELFAQQQLGTVPEERWKDWASGMHGVGYFVNSGVPDPRSTLPDRLHHARQPSSPANQCGMEGWNSPVKGIDAQRSAGFGRQAGWQPSRTRRPKSALHQARSGQAGTKKGGLLPSRL